jgi:hypothetical protein
VSEKIELVLKVISERSTVRFSELFETAANRWEVICTFLALLELIRLKQLACTQPEPFAEIEIGRAKAGEPAGETPEEPPAKFTLAADDAPATPPPAEVEPPQAAEPDESAEPDEPVSPAPESTPAPE